MGKWIVIGLGVLAIAGGTIFYFMHEGNASSRAQLYFDQEVKPRLGTGDEAQIRDGLLHCLVLDPQFVPALFRLGEYAEDDKAWGSALDYFQKARAATKSALKRQVIDVKMEQVNSLQQIESSPSEEKKFRSETKASGPYRPETGET